MTAKNKKSLIFYSLETDSIFELKPETGHYLMGMMVCHDYGFNVSMIFLGVL